MRGIAIVVIAACGGSAVGPVRFANAPTAWWVDDRHDVPTPPRERPYRRLSYHFESYYQIAMRGLDLARSRRSLGVNAFDEVPDSTWFTNRIGVRPVSPDEIERGPLPGSPEPYLPWTIKRTKSGGMTVGFLVEDRRGAQFLLKFDRKGKPEIETATDAITSRLLWAAGYNVPSDHVVYFRREDLRLAPDAYTKIGDKKHPLDAAALDALLARCEVQPDGRIRGLASIWIHGTPLGGMPRLGVRRDDPNDRIPHELRRDQRGQAALFAWLSHTDIREDNTLDVWQTDPADRSVHYVVHYLVDFGNALDAALGNQRYIGHEYDVDPSAILASTLSLGLNKRAWEGREPSPILGIGLYTADGYDPGAWKPSMPAQLPVLWADRFDQFWGSKILIRFTREQLTAAVRAGRFTDPRAVPYLVETLIERQRLTARYWFDRVGPLDDFVFAQPGLLCFSDLALRHGLVSEPTHFTVRAFDRKGAALGTVRGDADAAGHACIAAPLAAGGDRYTIFQIASSRRLPPTFVHVAAEPTSGRLRVIGIHRE